MPENYIVTNKDGLLVRSQMNTKNDANIKRKMSANEGFTVYQTYVQNGNETWGRLSNDPGALQQEYTCISIGNRVFAKREEAPMPSIPYAISSEWATAIDAWARSNGFKGPKPTG